MKSKSEAQVDAVKMALSTFKPEEREAVRRFVRSLEISGHSGSSLEGIRKAINNIEVIEAILEN